MLDENYATLWEAVGDMLPDHDAIVTGDRRLVWRDFDDRSARLASAMQSLGLGHESKAAAYLYNCNEYLEVVNGAFKLRAVPINVNFRYVEDELTYVLGDSESEVLVFQGAFADRVAAIRDRLPRLRALIQVDDGSPLLDGALPYESVLADHEPMERIARSGDDHWILYTGGTTGLPKGVVWRHGPLSQTLMGTYALAGVAPPESLAEAADHARHLSANGKSPITMPASPLIHGTAFMLSQTTLLLGGRVVFLEERSLDAHRLWSAVERERVTQIVIVGDAFAKPMVRALQEAEEQGRPYDITSVTQIVSSGVMWSAETKAELLKRGAMLLADMLGASEGGPFGTSMVAPGAHPETATFKIGDRAKLLRDDGTEIPRGADEIGVLAVTEPIPDGYYRDPEKTARTFRQIGGKRYAIPGDYARVLEDGTLVLLGRGSVCINTGGEKVYPEEVEEAVKRHPAIDDCNVVGVPDPKWGEAVTAVVSLRPGESLTCDELREFLGDKIAGYKRPKHLVIVDKVSRSPAGKADYRWAREAAADELELPDES